MSCYVKNVNGSYSTGERESRESRERWGLLEMGSTWKAVEHRRWLSTGICFTSRRERIVRICAYNPCQTAKMALAIIPPPPHPPTVLEFAVQSWTRPFDRNGHISTSWGLKTRTRPSSCSCWNESDPLFKSAKFNNNSNSNCVAASSDCNKRAYLFSVANLTWINYSIVSIYFLKRRRFWLDLKLRK